MSTAPLKAKDKVEYPSKHVYSDKRNNDGFRGICKKCMERYYNEIRERNNNW